MIRQRLLYGHRTAKGSRGSDPRSKPFASSMWRHVLNQCQRRDQAARQKGRKGRVPGRRGRKTYQPRTVVNPSAAQPRATRAHGGMLERNANDRHTTSSRGLFCAEGTKGTDAHLLRCRANFSFEFLYLVAFVECVVMAPRANWKSFLRLSLVTRPLALYPATSDTEKISFNQINRNTGHRIKYLKVDADTGEEVSSDDIINGYKVDTDTYIEVSKDELENIAVNSTRTIEIDRVRAQGRHRSAISDPTLLSRSRRQGWA